MTDELLTAFDDSLSALAAGEPLNGVLARYPHLHADLRPMLEAAEFARRAGTSAPAPAAAQNRSRAQFLTRAAALRQPRRGFLGRVGLKSWRAANRALALTLAFIMGFGLGTYGVLTATAASLPGEPLYGVKRTLEQTQLLLAASDRAREQLAADFDERRVNEVERLLAGARQAKVTFGGVLTALDGERWTVAGLTVVVPRTAELAGTPFPGLYVSVEGLSQADGTVVATRVEVQGLAFIGQVTAQASQAWQVGQTQVRVTAETAIRGDPRPGDWVSVNARRLPDGAWLAFSIERLPGAPQAPPAATPTLPAPTKTPPNVPTLAPPADDNGVDDNSGPGGDDDNSGPGGGDDDLDDDGDDDDNSGPGGGDGHDDDDDD